MKRILSIVLAITLIVAFAGCGCSNKEAATSHEISGEVLDANGKTMTIETDANEQLTFNYEGVEVDDPDGMGFEYGQVATISYEGEIKDGDTSGCKVTHAVITLGDEKYVTGKLAYVDDTEGLIAITTEDDRVLPFNVSNAERHYDKGLKIGDDMVVIYMGKINGEDTSRLYVTAVVDESVYNLDTEEETVTVKAVDETIWTKGDVNIREGSSTTSDVVKEVTRGTKLHRTGVLSNGWSRIEYKGKDRYIVSDAVTKKEPKKKKTTTAAKTTAATTTATTTTATTEQPTTSTEKPVTETTVTEEPTSETAEPATEETTAAVSEIGSPIKGVIKDFSASEEITRMVLDCGNGVIYDLDVSKADIHILEGEIIDKKVVVEFEGKIKGSDTSGIKVTLVHCDD